MIKGSRLAAKKETDRRKDKNAGMVSAQSKQLKGTVGQLSATFF